MTDPNQNDRMEELPLWRIVCQHLIRPRTWIYPIIVLIIVFFVLPRLSHQATWKPKDSNNETPVFRDGEKSDTPSETTDSEGNIHRFFLPQNEN